MPHKTPRSCGALLRPQKEGAGRDLRSSVQVFNFISQVAPAQRRLLCSGHPGTRAGARLTSSLPKLRRPYLVGFQLDGPIITGGGVPQQACALVFQDLLSQGRLCLPQCAYTGHPIGLMHGSVQFLRLAVNKQSNGEKSITESETTTSLCEKGV